MLCLEGTVTILGVRDVTLNGEVSYDGTSSISVTAGTMSCEPRIIRGKRPQKIPIPSIFLLNACHVKIQIATGHLPTKHVQTFPWDLS